MERNAQPAIEELALADWRRRIAELYAEVRHLALTDPPAAHAHWREVRERLYRDHVESPLPPAERPGFRAHHFPYDPGVRFEVAVDAQPVAPPAAAAAGLTLPNSGTDVLAFRRVGVLEIPFAGAPRRLSLFWMEGYAGGLFLPFRDATNGQETYGAGRYLLDGAKGADLGGTVERGGNPGRTLVLDFNFAYQPSCAFDPRWACPLAPPENRLDVAIRAGERLA